MERQCYRCGTVKPFTAEFYGRDRGRKHGLKTLCRECEKTGKRAGGPYYYPAGAHRFTREMGINYKKALPEYCWPEAERFMRTLTSCALQAQAAGVKKLDIGAFLAEYGGHHRGRRPERNEQNVGT